VFREYGCRKRDEGHAEKQDQIEPRQGFVRSSDQREEAMMIHPHHADVEEAGQKREIRRPLVRQGDAQTSSDELVRDFDLQDQQRDGNGEDAVAERLDAAGLVHENLYDCMARASDNQ